MGAGGEKYFAEHLYPFQCCGDVGGEQWSARGIGLK